jgi:hypothetical protein
MSRARTRVRARVWSAKVHKRSEPTRTRASHPARQGRRVSEFRGRSTSSTLLESEPWARIIVIPTRTPSPL